MLSSPSSPALWPLAVIAVVIMATWLLDALRSYRRRRRAAADGPLLIYPLQARERAVRPASMPPLTPLTPLTPLAPPAPSAAPAGPDSSPTVQLYPAALGDGTIQLLPGWLEVVRGHEAGHEIRFVRMSGEAVPQITLGRAEGPEYRHIRIPEVTVSRLHARMSYQDRLWRIANLSSTNPVKVNGRALAALEESAALADGDRVELGGVELRFREGSA